MAIQWFPGHMHLTRKAIAERVKETDVVIEVLDARLPGSSANPLLAELTGHKPTLRILNKEDLADPARTTRRSALTLVLFAALFVLIVAGSLWLAWTVLQLLLTGLKA